MSDITAPDAPIRPSIFSRLYNGETNFDFVGRRRRWLAISGVVILAGLLSLALRGMNFGIDFEGGSVWEVPANGVSVREARDALAPLGLRGADIQTLSTDRTERLRVKAEFEDQERQERVADRLAKLTRQPGNRVSINSVGPSWGSEISSKARNALIIFLVVITVYITLRFEFKMAVPTLAALAHDILVTVGVYSLAGFEVTPATVIAFLTILGYSIYDGIVVFDKVHENVPLVSSTGRMTYSDVVNLSLNQTLMRSLNTSITAVLPILSLLVIGSFILGARTLQEFALALLVGLAASAYSSIFIASPMLAWLKERESRYRDVRRRIEARAPILTEAAESSRASPLPAERIPARAHARAGAPASPTSSSGGTSLWSPNRPPRPRKRSKKK